MIPFARVADTSSRISAVARLNRCRRTAALVEHFDLGRAPLHPPARGDEARRRSGAPGLGRCGTGCRTTARPAGSLRLKKKTGCQHRRDPRIFGQWRSRTDQMPVPGSACMMTADAFPAHPEAIFLLLQPFRRFQTSNSSGDMSCRPCCTQ